MKPGLDNWVDILIITLYFVFVMLVGLWSMCRKERNTAKGYFLAGRSMKWFPIGASLFASNIGSEHFIGLAGSGAAGGIAVVAFEWGAALCLLLLGWVFLPVYLSSGLFTIPEYLARRFGGNRLRIYLSILALFLYICTKISVDIYAGSVFVQQALGWNTYISIAAILVVTAVYTVVGGLAAVIFTDTLQTIIMLIGSVVLAILGFVKVGGMNGLMVKYFEAVPTRHGMLYLNNTNMSDVTYFNSTNNSTCGLPRADAFHILRDPLTSDLPWPGVLIRSTFVSMWYWCADQVIVQRVLAAKNIGHARGATIMAGYLKFLPLFLIIMPGMISRVLFPDTVGCADRETCMNVCENPTGCSNIAYPQLILGLAPIGLRGLMMAVMMAALMSSLTSVFNSAATVFTMDIWRRVRKSATEREQLIVGKIFVLILVGISILWIPLIQAAQQGQLFLYIQALTGYIAPPICSVFLLAIFVPRVTEKGAFWGMLVGQISGLIRMVLDFVYPSPGCGEPDNRPAVVAKVHFTYFAALILVLTALIVIVVSLLEKPKKNNSIKGLTYWTVEPVRPPPKETFIPETVLNDEEVSIQESDDKYVTYPMKDIVNEAYHSDESVEEQVNTSHYEDKLKDEINQVQVQTTNSTSVERERPALRRTKSNRDAVFDKVIRQSQTEETVTEYRVENGPETTDTGKEETGEPGEKTVELRNKRIRVKKSSYASDMSLEIHSEFLKRKSEVEKAQELEKIEELKRQAEMERQRELERQREIERQQELKRLKEIEIQKELERMQELQRIQEIKRKEMERKREIEAQMKKDSKDQVQTLLRNKLYISSKFDFFLNLNAVILLCVFVFLYCIFA
ncbi:sodium/mannose cotransporter SLC5A10-like [Saccostrea echinata]|uniref:sodium/mannose cotransporter SLC5A10-like n=1 Tax=Saccostrea echinata TaxID=191078 RepID=UPI002A7F55B6|nr:sodium/mannose cotransporter SLC5A10-like [Saccostrea echinata]